MKKNKLKCPLNFEIKYPRHINQENAIFCLLLKLEQLQINFLEEFLSMTYQVDCVNCGVSFCIDIMVIILNKKHHKYVITKTIYNLTSD